jgi:hypothetical protein
MVVHAIIAIDGWKKRQQESDRQIRSLCSEVEAENNGQKGRNELG